MKPSNDAARIYAVLALRAAGHTVDRRSVEEIWDRLGLRDDREGVAALLHLLAVVQEETAADQPLAAAASPSADATDPFGAGAAPGLDRTPPERGETGRAPWRSSLEQDTVAAVEGWADDAVMPPDSPPEIEDAFYIYGIVEGEPLEDADLAGIEGRRVEAVSFHNVTALGHPCPAVPYAAPEAEIVIGWLEEHDAVLRRALKTYTAVVPCKFNTIVKADGRSAGAAVHDWLEERGEELATIFARVRGRIEYGLRVLWQPEADREATPGGGPSRDASDAEAPLPPGVRYLLEEQLKRRSAESRRQAQTDLRVRCLAAISPLTEGIVEQRRDGAEEEDQTVLRCACLVPEEMSARFLGALEHLKTSEQVEVQVTGPWPAYSFVSDRMQGVQP